MISILITGSGGQLASSFKKLFHSKYELINSSKGSTNSQSELLLDITNSIACRDIINAVSPDIILNLSGLTNVDYCERNPDLAYAINVEGVENLINNFNGPIIHISSDYVFNGEDGPYDENDKTNPLNVYGSTKLRSESILLEHPDKNLVMRGNVLYDFHQYTESSFLNWVIESLYNKREIHVVNDQINNPTWTCSFAVAIDRAIDLGVTGLIHWGDAEIINRYDFALKIADMFKLDKKLIHPITTIKLSQYAKRPLKSGLKTDYAQNTLNLEPPSIEECLRFIIEINK